LCIRAIALPSWRCPASAVLGRNPGPEGVPWIRHSTVSRNHAAIECDAGARTSALIDPGSHKGTSLDGVCVHGDTTARLPPR
jgi:hypothetical protein